MSPKFADRLPTAPTAIRSGMSSAAGDVTALLIRRRWTEVRRSERAALWMFPASGAELYVPYALRRDTIEWDGVLERIAAPTAENPRDIERSIEQNNFDVVRYRVNATGETIPLETAATVISSAYGMLRAAATAARKPRATINNYAKVGDEIASSARLGHTEQGSFVFPVLVHVDEPAAAPGDTLETVDQVTPESNERRVTRTLAQALSAFQKQIVEPDTQPTAKNMLPIIYAGGTRELFNKAATALAEPDIAFLETGFTWAGAEPAADDLPTAVHIPAEASRLLRDASRVLSDTKKETLRVFVGPIFRIEHKHGEPFGLITMSAAAVVEGTRKSRVEVPVRATQMGDLHDWMHAGTTVVVQGQVERRPGHYARLTDITVPQPLSATLEGLE